LFQFSALLGYRLNPNKIYNHRPPLSVGMNEQLPSQVAMEFQQVAARSGVSWNIHDISRDGVSIEATFLGSCRHFQNPFPPSIF
jgi:hypothetical protein